MNFSNPYSRDLGVFTWAALQAAYPNGGGALAALPTGSEVYVSDWSARFTPDSGKTYWKPTNGTVKISAQVAAFTTYLAEITGAGTFQKFVAPVTPTLPANFLQVGCGVFVSFAVKRTTLATAPVSANIHVYVGTSDSTSDANLHALAVSATLDMVGLAEIRNQVVTTGKMRYIGFANRTNANMSGANTADQTSNINTASAMYVNIVAGSGFKSGAANDVVRLYEFHVWVMFP